MRDRGVDKTLIEGKLNKVVNKKIKKSKREKKRKNPEKANTYLKPILFFFFSNSDTFIKNKNRFWNF